MILSVTAMMIGGGIASADPGASPYFTANFTPTPLGHPFQQSPAWTADGRGVLSAEPDANAVSQIFRSRPDGSGRVCLTCRSIDGPSGAAHERPQGDWILFQSYASQPVHFGNPGLGGYGGDLYAMRPDGSDVYRLTTDSDPNGGAKYTSTDGIPYDNFHAYLSPDGKHVVWTHTEARPLREGGESWEMMLGDFVVRNGVPSIANVRVVGPPYGAYETQPWSPDGKGFLFAATGGNKSPFEKTAPGWGNMRVFYMRVFGDGASPESPRVTAIADNGPYYQEQAVFTPDMQSVVFMSDRGGPQETWYRKVARGAQQTGFDSGNLGATQSLQFLADFSGPEFQSDLFQVDGPTGKIRRLTQFHGIIPEFQWNQDNTQLIWSFGGRPHADTMVSEFPGVDVGNNGPPARTPKWLMGEPIDMARIGDQAMPTRHPGAVDNHSVRVVPPSSSGSPNSAKALPPLVVTSYFVPWDADMIRLSIMSGQPEISMDAKGIYQRFLGPPVEH